MKEKPTAMDVLKCVWVEDAIEILDSLPAEDVLWQDVSGATVLHHLCFGRQVQPFSFDIEPVIEKIITKNPNILRIKWNDLGTPIEMAIREDDLRAVKILLPYYRKFKEEVVMHETEAVWRMKKRKAGVKEVIVTESNPLLFAAKNRFDKMFFWFLKNELSFVIGRRVSEYNLDDPKPKDLQELYLSLLWLGRRDVLKALHNYLGYYDGHDGKNSSELEMALSGKVSPDESKCLDLISKGHYIYSSRKYEPHESTFIVLHTFAHPNFDVGAKYSDKYSDNINSFHIMFRYGREVTFCIFIKMLEQDVELFKKVLGFGQGFANLIIESFFEARDRDLRWCLDTYHEARAKLAILINAVEKDYELLRAFLAPDKDGNNILHLAVKDNARDVLKVLLTCKSIDVHKRNKEGQTALDIAKCSKSRAEPSMEWMIEEHIKAQENKERLLAKIDFVRRIYSFVWEVFTGAAKTYSGDMEIEIDMPKIKPKSHSKGRCQPQSL